jgi:hypothetical protein
MKNTAVLGTKKNIYLKCCIVFFVFVLSSTLRSVSCNLIHTPVGSDHAQRNLNLINELRNKHHFDLNSDSNFMKNQSMSMTDDLGVQYSCVYVNISSSKDGSETDSDNQNSNANDKKTKEPSQPNQPTQSTTNGRESAISNKNHDLPALRGICVEFPRGWWTYRWCHRQQVTQFHKEKNGAAVGTSWSLGVYDAHKTQKERLRILKKASSGVTKNDKTASSSRATNVNNNNNVDDRKYSYYFSNGQHCDETKSGRKSAVHITCCRKNNENGNRNPALPDSSNFITLLSLVEKETCSYEINICTPIACPPELTPTQKRFSVHALLKPLEKVCMQKQDGWWTYEFCYRHHVRQLHLHTSTDNKGKHTTKIQSEFILGKFQGSKHAGVNENEDKNSFRQSVESVDRKAFVQEYKNGHDCGITGQRRSSDVYFICKGKKTANYIVSIKEDRTCHYNIVVNSPLLCEHELFKSKDNIKRQLICKIK